MNKEETEYQRIGKAIKGAELGQLFGKPSLKINGKPFACFFQNCMVFKLGGDAHKGALSLDGAILFDPSGKNRPMKEWVQVPFDYCDKWEGFAREALKYIS